MISKCNKSKFTFIVSFDLNCLAKMIESLNIKTYKRFRNQTKLYSIFPNGFAIHTIKNENKSKDYFISLRKNKLAKLRP